MTNTGTLLLALSLLAFTSALTLESRMSGLVVGALAALAAAGFAVFVWHQARTPAPLVRLELLRDRPLSAGLVSLMLVSAILMATLVVGPFYLANVLGLVPVDTGLVLSVGPVVAALTGTPVARQAIETVRRHPDLRGAVLA